MVMKMWTLEEMNLLCQVIHLSRKKMMQPREKLLASVRMHPVVIKNFTMYSLHSNLLLITVDIILYMR